MVSPFLLGALQGFVGGQASKQEKREQADQNRREQLGAVSILEKKGEISRRNAEFEFGLKQKVDEADEAKKQEEEELFLQTALTRLDLSEEQSTKAREVADSFPGGKKAFADEVRNGTITSTKEGDIIFRTRGDVTTESRAKERSIREATTSIFEPLEGNTRVISEAVTDLKKQESSILPTLPADFNVDLIDESLVGKFGKVDLLIKDIQRWNRNSNRIGLFLEREVPDVFSPDSRARISTDLANDILAGTAGSVNKKGKEIIFNTPRRIDAARSNILSFIDSLPEEQRPKFKILFKSLGK